jgi:hypothetical protein
MKSTLSCAAGRSTGLIVSPGWLRSLYSISSTFLCPSLKLEAAGQIDLVLPKLEAGKVCDGGTTGHHAGLWTDDADPDRGALGIGIAGHKWRG